MWNKQINMNDDKIEIFEFIAIEQIDNYSFNRGALFNVGVQYILNQEFFKNVKWIVLHDVDWIPLVPTSYYPTDNHIHFIHIMPLKYSNFAGGVNLISLHAYQCINGHSNQFWGWGLEDDDLYTRLSKDKFYMNGCNLNVTNLLNVTLNYAVYTDYNGLSDTQIRKRFKELEQAEHYRAPKINQEVWWNKARWNLGKPICEKNGDFMKNDGLNNMLKYNISKNQKYGKLRWIQVEFLEKNDSWRSHYPDCKRSMRENRIKSKKK